MKSLNDVAWKEFKIYEVFISEPEKSQIPTGAYVNKQYLKKAKKPRVTVTSFNNGVDDFCESNHKNFRCHSNFISISFLGDCFYHPYTTSIDMKVHCLQLKDKSLNKYLAKFLIACLLNNTKNCSYGNQLSSTDLPKKSILLPVNSQGTPNWQFMEEYIKEKEQNLKEKYKKYVQNRINKFEKFIKEGKEWKEFEIRNIFDISSGKRLTQAEMKSGKIPFVSAAAVNNGITSYISNINGSLDKNVLGVNYDGNGGMVISFYHPYECLFSDSVKRFHLKNKKDNKYLLLFFKEAILKQRVKYVYGYKFNETRMKRQKIMLPVNSKEEPDYEYMENYMKHIEQQKLLKYLEYCD